MPLSVCPVRGDEEPDHRRVVRPHPQQAQAGHHQAPRGRHAHTTRPSIARDQHRRAQARRAQHRPGPDPWPGRWCYPPTGSCGFQPLNPHDRVRNVQTHHHASASQSGANYSAKGVFLMALVRTGPMDCFYLWSRGLSVRSWPLAGRGSTLGGKTGCVVYSHEVEAGWCCSWMRECYTVYKWACE